MLNSNRNYCMHILAELEIQKTNFSPYMRTRDMEDAQGFYNHEEEIGGLHTNMGNVETESNGRRNRQDLVTMSSLQKEVQSYRADNERIMKAQEEILQSLNMLHKQVNKDSGTKQAS
jgi:hypothetical protein